jgi:uncharacterized delta-60 repeat protein
VAINGSSQNVSIDANGRIVSSGIAPSKSNAQGVAIVRLTTGGQLDTSFNKTGVVDLQVGYDDQANALVIQPDGKILVGGSAWPTLQGFRSISDDTEFFLARYNPDGTPDTTFGKRGLVVMNPTPLEDGIGKLAVIPTPGDPTGNPFRIVALAADDKVYEFDQYGNLIPSFGNKGIATYQLTPHFGINDFVVAPAPNGSPLSFDLILSGTESSTAWHNTGALLAVNAMTGTPDPLFNGGQWLSVADPNGGALAFNSIALQPNPTPPGGYSIIVAGGSWMQGVAGGYGVLARFSLTGTLDTSFGTNGFDLTPNGGFNKVAVEPSDNSIVVEGQFESGNLTVGHFTANGQQDTMFGDPSTGYTVIPGINGNSLVIQPDGNIVVSGYNQVSPRSAFFARLTYSPE